MAVTGNFDHQNLIFNGGAGDVNEFCYLAAVLIDTNPKNKSEVAVISLVNTRKNK